MISHGLRNPLSIADGGARFEITGVEFVEESSVHGESIRAGVTPV